MTSPPSPKTRTATTEAMPKKPVDLSVEYRPIGELRPNPENTRRHPLEQIRRGKILLLRFGFQTPITIDKANVIWKGNGIFTCAAELFAEGHAQFGRIPVTITTLKGAELAAYATADNRLGEMSVWDLEALEELEALAKAQEVPIEACGFIEAEIRRLLKDLDAAPPPAAPPPPAASLGAPLLPAGSLAPPPAPAPPPSTEQHPGEGQPRHGRRRAGREPGAQPQPIAPQPPSTSAFDQERPIVIYYHLENFERASKILDDLRAHGAYPNNSAAILGLLTAWRRDPSLFTLAGAAP